MALRGRAANREGFILNSIDRAAFADERFLRVRKLRLRLARRKKQRNFARKLRTGHRLYSSAKNIAELQIHARLKISLQPPVQALFSAPGCTMADHAWALPSRLFFQHHAVPLRLPHTFLPVIHLFITRRSLRRWSDP